MRPRDRALASAGFETLEGLTAHRTAPEGPGLVWRLRPACSTSGLEAGLCRPASACPALGVVRPFGHARPTELPDAALSWRLPQVSPITARHSVAKSVRPASAEVGRV